MKLVFVDPCSWDYNIDTVYERPLGGSQSALCYLAEALARRGHQVYLLNGTTRPGLRRGVQCLRLPDTSSGAMQAVEPDAYILLNVALPGQHLREFAGPRAKVILWTQHASDQPAMAPLKDPATHRPYDGIAFVSEWQRNDFIAKFAIDPLRTAVLRNAISPHFANLFPAGAPILAAKARPPVLAYTSTPFRGLNLLASMFPAVRSAVPGLRLKVFSSLAVYQVPAEKDNQDYGKLYNLLRQTEGVELIGSVPQARLAQEMREVTALAYPNTFAETSCIAVMEAMAAGCWIVTSELGALPETTAGFARLFNLNAGVEPYCQQFATAMAQILGHLAGNPGWSEFQDHLARQVRFANDNYTWDRRAQEWEQWLAGR